MDWTLPKKKIEVYPNNNQNATRIDRVESTDDDVDTRTSWLFYRHQRTSEKLRDASMQPTATSERT